MIIKGGNFDSSNVQNFKYDSETKKLTVVFKSSHKRYVYKDVDKPTFYTIIEGKSVGGAIAIIKKKFACDIEEDLLPAH